MEKSGLLNVISKLQGIIYNRKFTKRKMKFQNFKVQAFIRNKNSLQQKTKLLQQVLPKSKEKNI